MSKEEVPNINVKLEERVVEPKTIRVSWVFLEPPYIMLSDKNGTRKIWTKNKKRIILYYLYQITRIKWFIKKYNEQSR